jgi:hypothetical protein
MVRRDIAFERAPEKEKGISDLCLVHGRKGSELKIRQSRSCLHVVWQNRSE